MIYKAFDEISDTVITIPDRIAGNEVNAIAPKCFAGKRHIEEVVLPDCVTSLGEYAFYNCRSLKKITIGRKLKDIYDGSFMNCSLLRHIDIRAGIKDITYLKTILDRIKNTVEVSFVDEGEVVLKLVYPEFAMVYEPVFAAHIFQMRVNGTGYAPRHAFRDGVIDLPGYDEAMVKGFPSEDDETICLTCAFRLLYPVDLLPEFRDIYEKTIAKKERSCVLVFAKRDEALVLKKLLLKNIISQSSLRYAVEYARSEKNTRFLTELVSRN